MKILFLIFWLFCLFFPSSNLFAEGNHASFASENSMEGNSSSVSQTKKDENAFVTFPKEGGLPTLHLDTIIQKTDDAFSSIGSSLFSEGTYRTLFSKETGRSDAYETDFGKFQLLSCEGGTLGKERIFLGMAVSLADGWQLSKPLFFPQSIENIQKITPFYPFSPEGKFSKQTLFPIILSLQEASQPFQLTLLMQADACSEAFGCQTLLLPFSLSLPADTGTMLSHCFRMKAAATNVPLQLLPADSHLRFQKKATNEENKDEKDFDLLSVFISCPTEIKEAEVFFFDKTGALLEAEINEASFSGTEALLHIKPFFSLSDAKKAIVRTDRFLYEKDFILEEGGESFSFSQPVFLTFENCFLVILVLLTCFCGFTLLYFKTKQTSLAEKRKKRL